VYVDVRFLKIDRVVDLFGGATEEAAVVRLASLEEAVGMSKRHLLRDDSSGQIQPRVGFRINQPEVGERRVMAG
jgi:pyrroloquinoline quinone (PQQ) biosynthesis protein C